MNLRTPFAAVYIIVLCLFAITSCKHSTSTELTKSLDNVNTVTPISGSQDIVMSLEKGTKGFFSVWLDGGSELDGWCIEWDEDASFGTNKVTKMYSTRGHEDWKEINFLMENLNNIKASNSNITYRDIQVVIWSFIKKPAFDIDKIAEYNKISARIYYNGKARFNYQRVEDLISYVKQSIAEGKRAKTGVTLIENDGQTVMIGYEITLP